MNILSKILSLYYSDFKDDELYKISQVLGNKNNNSDRLKLCEYIADCICNYDQNGLLYIYYFCFVKRLMNDFIARLCRNQRFFINVVSKI